MNPTTNDIENCFRKAGLKPVARMKIAGEDVFIADGFIEPDKQWILQRFDVAPGEFPKGCHMTAWILEERRGWHVGVEFSAAPSYSPLTAPLRVQGIIRKARDELGKRKRRKVH